MLTPAKARALGVAVVVGGIDRDSVVRTQASVATQMVATAVVVDGCKDKIDGPTMVQWEDLARRCLAFSSLVLPTFGPWDDQMATGASLLKELNAWGPKLSALGCSNTPPPAPVPQPPPPTSHPDPFASLFAGAGDTLKWAAIAFLAYTFFQGRR